MLGLPKLVIDPCPIMEMIDFVKSQVNILNLESVEEINEYLNDNIPEAEWSLIGTLNLKFEGCTITLNNLIKLFYEMINDPNQHNNLNSCNALLKKINSFYNDLKEKSKQSNFITLTLMQKNIINVDTILKEIKSNLEKRMNTNERLEELV